MAKSKKLTKQELREPDEVFQASSAGLQWFQERWLVFLFAFVVIFAGGFGAALFSHYRFERESEAQMILAELTGVYQQWKLSDEEDREGLRAELDEKLNQLREGYSSSKATSLAAVYRARLALADQKWELAVEEFQNLQRALPNSEKSLARFGLAKVHEDRQDWAEALRQYDVILQETGSIFRRDALMGKARVLRQLNRNDEAVSVYESFLREFPSSPEASFARAFIHLSLSEAARVEP